MKKIILLIIIPLFTGSAFSQFNDSTHYYIGFSGSGNINKTRDATSYLLNNSLQFNVRTKNLEINTTNSYMYGENNHIKTNNDYFSIADVNLLKGKQKLYYWGLGNYEKSFSLHIKGRLQAGAGLGYSVADKPAFRLLLSNGLLYESSHLALADKYGREKYETLRNSFRIKFRLMIKDRITLEGSDFLQNSLSDKNDYIIKSATALSFKLYKWLNLTTSVNYNRLNLTGDENLLISYGLSAKHYF